MPKGNLRDRITDLEREVRLKDERIAELKDEIDEGRELIRRMEEHVQERDEYLERFITTFGMELSDDNKWTWGPFINEHNALVDNYNDLIVRYNKLVRDFNRFAVLPQPVGRPLGASEAQAEHVLKLRKRGESLRGIADATNLPLWTVRTIIDKLDGTDRTTALHRRRLGLEPKRKDWRPAAMDRLPKQATQLFEVGAELRKEAKRGSK
jgi:hypothetical protein